MLLWILAPGVREAMIASACSFLQKDMVIVFLLVIQPSHDTLLDGLRTGDVTGAFQDHRLKDDETLDIT